MDWYGIVVDRIGRVRRALVYELIWKHVERTAIYNILCCHVGLRNMNVLCGFPPVRALFRGAYIELFATHTDDLHSVFII
jgi:hypothetical protein